MPRKNKKQPENPDQMKLFDYEESLPQSELEEINLDELDYEELAEELGINEENSDRTIELKPELLTLKLWRQAIQANHPDDSVMADFAEYVLGNLLRVAIGVTAKGGKFFDAIDRRNLAEGNPKVRRDNAGDQSLNTHILNGLFPANVIERRLQKLNTTIARTIKERERRLVIASFILHDFEKFDYNYFPQMPEKYKQIRSDLNQDIRKLTISEHREIIKVIVEELGLDKFLVPDNPSNWLEYIDDLLFIAYNAQKRNDTNLNLSENSLNPRLSDRLLITLADLACLADRLASIIKHPQDALHKGINETLHSLSNGELKLTYHSIAENRGVLTNIVNNAVMEAHTSCNTDDNIYYQPLLYLPSGVIYLTTRETKPIDVESLPAQVVNNIKNLCQGELEKRQIGFGRDGKGIKYADYYTQFFDHPQLIQVALKATTRILKSGKKSNAQSRSENLLEFQKKQILSKEYDFKFDDDLRIDQLAEFGDVVTRKICGDCFAKIEQARKSDKSLPSLPELNLILEIAEYWHLEKYIPPLRQIQKINETLKEHKLKGNTGGVPLDWYYLAAKYLQHHPGIEDVRPICEDLVKFISSKIVPIIQQYPTADKWQEVRQWVRDVVMLPNQEIETNSKEIFFKELDNYQNAKKEGRGRQLICSLSHSAYTVTEQMESAVLFTPQVYTNKQKLGGANAKRNISSIAGTEMMLRQILMNQTQAVGKDFEDGKYRYLYFYPTYYFTPETNNLLQKAYANIAQTRFDTSLKEHFVSKELIADFTRTNYQTVDSFLIDEDLQLKKELPENNPKHKKDRSFKLAYPENKPLTFYFMALPPGKDPTDTESWILPAWLGLVFPMILDVKTVVSESPIPPYRDGAEFEETVFLDSLPQAFRVLIQAERLRLDYILETWSDEAGKIHSAPLNALTAAYAIHLDVNPKRGKSGYDANWGKFSELATNLETSPLYVFHYLNKWTRGQGAEVPSIQRIKLYTYNFYPCFDPYVQVNHNQEMTIMSEESPLNHPQNLTRLYRQFYRAHKMYSPKANAVLKPLEIAAETLLKAEASVFSGETLVAVVAAEICKLMDRVHASTAEGRWVLSDREQERQAVLDFARYFVVDVFEKAFKGDRARLAGRQLNLIKDTCEFLYRLEQDQENQQHKAQGKLPEKDSSVE